MNISRSYLSSYPRKYVLNLLYIPDSRYEYWPSYLLYLVILKSMYCIKEHQSISMLMHSMNDHQTLIPSSIQGPAFLAERRQTWLLENQPEGWENRPQ
jgi:hypothetical protein